jgi:lysophospholipase L1-like esterase
MREWLSRCAAVLIAMVLVGIGAQQAAADDGRQGSGGQEQEHRYLALGDSIPFGFNPDIDPPAEALYKGYPEKAASDSNLALTNASCPGQSSSGFISLTGTDNGCFGFRQFPGAMHTSYASSQLDYAVSFLRSHTNTRLVNITLGGNDLLICNDHSTDQCASELPNVLKDYEKNLKKILKAIRKVYDGTLVAVTYYSPDYRDSAFTGSVAAINDVEASVVGDFRGTIADGFAAFAAKAATYGGDSCAAGLLIRLIRPDPNGSPCDVHPSPDGAKLLADTLTAAISCDRAYGVNRNREDSSVEAYG